jgi:hypothetical protein
LVGAGGGLNKNQAAAADERRKALANSRHRARRSRLSGRPLDCMNHQRAETLKEDRAISTDEAEIVTWMLVHASVAGPLRHSEPVVNSLRVVGSCPCGCPSVDFQVDGQTAPARPIADATGQTAEGSDVGVILWGRGDAITGLEFYELGAAVRALPLVRTLRAW